MKLILIGHRGVGKTSLLQRLLIYFNLRGIQIPVFDLDREIEKTLNAKIQDIFETLEEPEFRKLEIQIFEKIKTKSQFIISVGAGFPLENIDKDKDFEIVWVRRKTDSLGRIFLDRPRLNPELSPLDEYKKRYDQRNEKYKTYSNWIYDLPEGLSSPSEIEKEIFFNTISDLGGGITILPGDMVHFEDCYKRKKEWGLDFFEIRDDLISDKELDLILTKIPKEQILLSFRQKTITKKGLFYRAQKEGFQTDWALELGPPPFESNILSIHDRLPGESIQDIFLRFKPENKNQKLKLAVLIENFDELYQGICWQAEQPETRNFLPRSQSGRWMWARLWLKDRQKINFIKEGSGSAVDQPTVFDWLSCPARPLHFAAVLGSPVVHSYSPIEHGNYFRTRQAPFFSIQLDESEWSVAWPVLQKMGLTWAAVTSPLKKIAADSSNVKTKLVEDLSAANTLFLEQKKCYSENTDLIGFRAMIESFGDLGPTVIWGGGGTLKVLLKVLPQAQAYSVRTQQPRFGSDSIQPQTLIWAASPLADLPSHNWSPKTVIDLNYRDDSKAKEYCQQVGARYISGLFMFKAQAHEQRLFWERPYERK